MTQLEKIKNMKLNLELLEKSSNNRERRRYIKQIITKELLEELLKDFSSLAVSKILTSIGIRINNSTIMEFARKFNLKTNSIKDSSNLKSTRDKYRKTCIEKFGTENCLSKNSLGYEKRNETVKVKYNVENVFQLEDTKEKSKKTLNEKYGINNPCELPFFTRNNGKRSKLQKEVEKYLRSINIEFQVEVGKIFSKFNPWFNKSYSPIVDILLEKQKIIFEINGNIWHANPEIYKDNDLIKTWSGLLTGQQIRKRDLERKKQIESFGYKVIEIWEKDIRSNFQKVKDKINEILQIKIN